MTSATDRLDATFNALADPTRRAILARLARGGASVGELAAPFTISAPAISRHLKVLERAGLIQRERKAQQRHIRIDGGAFGEAADWLTQYHQFWERRLDALSDYLNEIDETKDPAKKEDEDG